MMNRKTKREANGFKYLKKIGRKISKVAVNTRKHLADLGFTNRLAICIIIMLIGGLLGGFYLAVKCINTGFTGSLICYTAVYTPIGTACSIVLARIVEKSRAENTGADGEGIKYAAMMRATNTHHQTNTMNSMGNKSNSDQSNREDRCNWHSPSI